MAYSTSALVYRVRFGVTWQFDRWFCDIITPNVVGGGGRSKEHPGHLVNYERSNREVSFIYGSLRSACDRGLAMAAYKTFLVTRRA